LDSGKKHPSLLRVAIDSVDYPNHKRVLDRVALEISAGETVALIGQSGSGKSTLALAILRLLDWKRGVVNGRIEFGAHGDLLRLPEREMRSIRGKEIALVLQSAASALNPMLRISTQFEEAWRAHSSAPWRTEGLAKAKQLLGEVDLPSDDPSFLRRYPKEISIGQAQRVLIAMSLLHDPRLLLADEPTSALDIVTQQEVLGLLRRLAASRRMATLFISHDLLSVAALCDRVAILHEGEIVEEAETAAIFRSPAHPYTRRLIGALPRLPVEVPPDGVTPLLALAEQTGSSPGDLGGPAKWVAAESSKSA
jgi:ABC-type dipeptide/oligopeptide/nickel transport system ATPase component